MTPPLIETDVARQGVRFENSAYRDDVLQTELCGSFGVLQTIDLDILFFRGRRPSDQTVTSLALPQKITGDQASPLYFAADLINVLEV
ncbi:MAG: hypothetical protein EXR82_09405 [Gammaproteobacteria bacterium]|nr:hypothetical protein [Gammaproteobacteria bacterium]